MTDLKDILHSVFQEDESEVNSDLSVVAKAGLLVDAYHAFIADPVDFRPGDLVQWKEGLRYDTEEGPFIVIDVNLEHKPIRHPKHGVLDYKTFGDEYKLADTMIGYIDGTGDMMLMSANSRRLEKYKGQLPADL